MAKKHTRTQHLSPSRPDREKTFLQFKPVASPVYSRVSSIVSVSSYDSLLSSVYVSSSLYDSLAAWLISDRQPVGTFRSLPWRDCCCCYSRCYCCCWRVANSNIQVFIVLYIRLPWPIHNTINIYLYMQSQRETYEFAVIADQKSSKKRRQKARDKPSHNWP